MFLNLCSFTLRSDGFPKVHITSLFLIKLKDVNDSVMSETEAVRCIVPFEPFKRDAGQVHGARKGTQFGMQKNAFNWYSFNRSIAIIFFAMHF